MPLRPHHLSEIRRDVAAVASILGNHVNEMDAIYRSPQVSQHLKSLAWITRERLNLALSRLWDIALTLGPEPP